MAEEEELDEQSEEEALRNFTCKLPARSRRLGPLQMSWGLAGTNLDADEEWRDELRAAIRDDSPPPSDAKDDSTPRAHQQQASQFTPEQIHTHLTTYYYSSHYLLLPIYYLSHYQLLLITAYYYRSHYLLPK